MSSARLLRALLWALGAVLVLLIPAWLRWNPLGGERSFLPHGVCYTWDQGLIALHVVSDALIGLAYFSIPVAILYFTRKRKDLPFSWIFLLFGIFIIACGATHWMEVWTLWYPDYWLAGAVKALTASASIPTAVALIFLIPKALMLPRRAELEQAKERLEAEVIERRRVEGELRLVQASLEQRVAQRTEELQRINQELETQRSSLREADKAKDRFLAVLAHELRNPLQPIRMSTYLLARSAEREPSISQAVGVIERQVNQLGRLLDDLLDVARITQDRLNVKREPIPLSASLDLAVETCRPLIDAKRQRLLFTNDYPEAWVRADKARLAQVIGNVMNNASKFTQEDGTIDVHVARDDGAVSIAVTDNGSGIRLEELPNIFVLFRRGSGRPENGLGIGLALAKRLVEMHGGSIEAYSAGEGRGVTVTIRLPTAPVVAPPVAIVSGSDDTAEKPLRLLVADDNVDGANSLARLLELNGHDVTVAYDGPRALELMTSQSFDAAILDIGMPGLNGYEVASRIRAEQPVAPLRLIAASGYGTQADKEKARAAGFDAHLTKPVQIETLLALLQGEMRRGRSR